MTLLLLYLALAIGVSFLCSLCEAVLLTLTISDAEVMARKGNRAGLRLRQFKQTIDRPLAAILTLNTIAHTVGAAGVGAQSIVVFGSAWVGATSAVLTLLVLVISEIIPKTIGATYARMLAPPATQTIAGMIWITYPVVVALDAVSRLLRGDGHSQQLTREQIEVIAELARTGGALKAAESSLLTNMLRLQSIQVERIMTPRTVMNSVPRDATAGELLDAHEEFGFSRMPVTGEGPDDILGYVLKHDIYRAIIDGHRDRRVEEMIRPIKAIHENTNLVRFMELVGETGEHLYLVVDEYGGTSGVVTLEDLLETILGHEIVDETDLVEDMRTLAKPD